MRQLIISQFRSFKQTTRLNYLINLESDLILISTIIRIAAFGFLKKSNCFLYCGNKVLDFVEVSNFYSARETRGNQHNLP